MAILRLFLFIISYITNHKQLAVDSLQMVLVSFLDHSDNVRVCDAVWGTEVIPPLRGHNGLVHPVAFSPGGTRIVTGSYDNIWQDRVYMECRVENGIDTTASTAL
jgi:WD40 repeat protein